MDISPEIVVHIKSLKIPLIVGVSGFGGAGKSTFANALGTILGAPVIGVDNFMKDRTLKNYSLWEAMDYARLKREVLETFVAGRNPLHYGHYGWGPNAIIETKDVPHRGIIIVEGVGLFRPEINQYLGYKIWIDCPVEEGIKRGKKRDRDEYHNPQDEQWDGIWKKNDVDYFEKYKPKEVVDLIFSNLDIVA
jgi:uridine kinase